MKRFNLDGQSLFVPPGPDAIVPGTPAPEAVNTVPSFPDFFSAYFAGRAFNVKDQKCSKMLEGMKRCFENNQKGDPVEQCQYYISGFERLSLAQ
mmetsp:Transcript_13804/g.23541  ORF Transcript_13804/g.23541 Transcript_13804/m.23541 type:complete len:94 (+) Transcript_13804:216-497(+)|eukprot:CAMPEP_0168618464 /NCGR_PEP_ID=MMETSP0449_2-20121227/6086_1 /TAXON_ID=1082188 /ORGANISM="Strombidium rassoulzadegani, Strain ras09" /LENGTH=93 /DNA_ID=CAMNT_0008659341 /DNA_START=207 /DNA_END=488 /DNA_ORIENTATION=+